MPKKPKAKKDGKPPIEDTLLQLDVIFDENDDHFVDKQECDICWGLGVITNGLKKKCRWCRETNLPKDEILTPQ